MHLAETNSNSKKKATEIAPESYNIGINMYQIQQVMKILMAFKLRTKAGEITTAESLKAADKWSVWLLIEFSAWSQLSNI